MVCMGCFGNKRGDKVISTPAKNKGPLGHICNKLQMRSTVNPLGSSFLFLSKTISEWPKKILKSFKHLVCTA